MQVLPTPIWKKKIRPIDHQILWFLLDIGAPGNVMMWGWQVNAAEQMGIHRVTMRRRIQVLIEAGCLLQGKRKGEVMINTSIFARQGDRTKLRMMSIDKRIHSFNKARRKRNEPTIDS